VTAATQAAGTTGGVAGATAQQKAPAGGVLGATTALASAATKQTLPFTGLPLWIAALAGAALLLVGHTLRSRASQVR
jgi:hypothetical protein